jgi:hypothetical protein
VFAAVGALLEGAARDAAAFNATVAQYFVNLTRVP